MSQDTPSLPSCSPGGLGYRSRHHHDTNGRPSVVSCSKVFGSSPYGGFAQTAIYYLWAAKSGIPGVMGDSDPTTHDAASCNRNQLLSWPLRTHIDFYPQLHSSDTTWKGIGACDKRVDH